MLQVGVQPVYATRDENGDLKHFTYMKLVKKMAISRNLNLYRF